MAKGTINGGSGSGPEDFRRQQEEMLALSREYGQARVTSWAEELKGMEEAWSAFSSRWQGSLEQMTALAFEDFEAMAAKGQSTAGVLSQSLEGALGDMSQALDDWSQYFLQTLEQVSLAWLGTGTGGGGGGGFLPFLEGTLNFGGWFHQGGVIEAHQGLLVPGGAPGAEEQMIIAQSGEGILPREAMARLGEKNFEALRSGRFESLSTGAAPQVNLTIQVQALDAPGVAGLNWDRLVQRHILPALQREMGRTW
jgi:hypothetical protein